MGLRPWTPPPGAGGAEHAAHAQQGGHRGQNPRRPPPGPGQPRLKPPLPPSAGLLLIGTSRGGPYGSAPDPGGPDPGSSKPRPSPYSLAHLPKPPQRPLCPSAPSTPPPCPPRVLHAPSAQQPDEPLNRKSGHTALRLSAQQPSPHTSRHKLRTPHPGFPVNPLPTSAGRPSHPAVNQL